MNEFIVIQGRQLQHPDICKHWDWRRPNGQLKDMACRSMMRKLQDLELLTLPKPLHSGHHQRKILKVSHAHLARLAEEAGVAPGNISVEAEELGVNLFLRVR